MPPLIYSDSRSTLSERGNPITPRPLFEDKYQICNGLRLHYLDWGNESATPLILLHGIHGHAHVWDRFAEGQRGRLNVLALDMRGHGESQWAADGAYRANEFRDDLAAFVDGLGLASATVLGLSLGGIVAFGLTATSPATVQRLVVVDIGPEIDDSALEFVRSSSRSMPSDFGSMDEAYRWALEYQSPTDADELYRRVMFALRPTADGRFTWRHDPAVDSLLRPGGPRNEGLLWDLWSRVTCPTLIVRGQRSELLTQKTARRMEEMVPDATFVEIPDAGHVVMQDNPAAFGEVVGAFLGGF